MSFELVPTEHADGHFAGTDYGGRIRILARSPKAILFTAYGLRLHAPRTSRSSSDTRILAKRTTKETLVSPDVAAMLDHAFGANAASETVRAWTTRGRGTLLVDGGGAALPLPAHQAAILAAQAWEKVTPTIETPLAGRIATCLQCGSDLKPQTVRHRFGDHILPDHPRSLRDCRRYANHEIIRVQGYRQREEMWPYVESFETWDGESLVDDHFCGDACAARYGRRAAVEGPRLPVGGEAPARNARPDAVDHYEREVRTVIVDGREFTI